MKILTLIVGVFLLGLASGADQSEPGSPEEQPIAELENAGKRQMETPEVVLQLKYDKGELNRIYLAQFRKPAKVWSPSVAGRSNLCADLCHAGLGGEACGPACSQLIPVGLHSALEASEAEGNVSNSSEGYGQPRVGVCPALCQNHMGSPLCQCEPVNSPAAVDWVAVCSAFCQDGYVLAGCPTCGSTEVPRVTSLSARALGSAAGWAAWCDVQCRQGHGGAACSCDRTPFQ